MLYKITKIQKSRREAKIAQRRPLRIAKEQAKEEAEPVSEENVFYASLAGMSQNDIDLNETAKNHKKPSVDFLRYFVLLLSLGIFAFSGYKVVEMLFSYVKAAQDYDAIRSLYYDEAEGDLEAVQFLRKTRSNFPIQDILSLQKQTGARVVQSEVSEGVEEVDKIRRSFRKLSLRNSDMFCWIKVQYTTIDYPVVQYSDNDFYLKRDFDKLYSPSGAIFADFRNSQNIMNNRHLIIYGHNMLDNNMFQPLITAYEKREDNFKTGLIELVTAEGIYYYEIFSVGQENPYSGYIQTYFESDEEYVDFLQTIKERSNFQKDIVLDADSKIITLSTCVNEYWLDRRFVVRGVLIDVK
ncbi:MAG: class B sortase [Oscillospiraceae bacterium]|jgi:sortase B|nr:class B sortase [Oscillospiraceae bacterium]